jgi:putative hydrolase of the HAD superfamily
MRYTTLFFDLDATLYPASNGLWEEIRLRIFKYMEEEIGIPKAEVPQTRDHYWKTYGTTLEGLRIHHQTNPAHYLAYVHDIPLDNFLEEDLLLREQLISLPQDLWVFTNADGKHAERVLDKLGITDLFSGVIDLIKLDYRVKPDPAAYHGALNLSGEDDPFKCVLFDDLLPNLIAAKEMGFTTSLVGKNGQAFDLVDFHLESIHDIQKIMPGLWKNPTTNS